MKKLMMGLGLTALLVSGTSQAIEGSVDIGKHSTNLNVGMGSASPGLFLKGNWLRSNDDGSATGAALGYNLNAGPLSFSPAVKAIYTHPKDGKDRFALAVGTGAGYRLNSLWGVYGEYFYAPEGLTNHLDSYQEVAGGISFTPVSLVTLRAGYQYVSLNNKGRSKDNVLVDGPYLSASVNF